MADEMKAVMSVVVNPRLERSVEHPEVTFVITA